MFPSTSGAPTAQPLYGAPTPSPLSSDPNRVNTTTTTTTTTANSTDVSSTRPSTNAAMTTPAKPAMTMPTDRTTWALSLLHQQKTGVPPLHQTLIDHDYEMAGILLAAGADLSECIQSPLSERGANDTYKKAAFSIVHACETKKTGNGSASAGIPTIGLSNQQIVEFVLYAMSKAPQENLHYAGTNALTLCLLSGAPWPILRKFCEASVQQCPALLSTRDKLGRTPLTIAAASGNPEIVELLLRLGASLKVADGQGLKPIDHALKHRHTKIIEQMIVHGVAAPKIAGPDDTVDLRRMKQNTKNTNRFLKQLFNQQDMDNLLAYQNQSDRHRVTVFKALMSLCRKAANEGPEHALDRLLDFAKPLTTNNRLAKIAIAIARRPGKLQELMCVVRRVDEGGFPKKKLAALRDAAGESRDPAMLELALSLDHALVKLLGSKAKPNATQQGQLNRLLALAMQSDSGKLVKQLVKRGAKLDLHDPALAGLPMVAILADFGGKPLLAHEISDAVWGRFLKLDQVVRSAVPAVMTGEGLLAMMGAFEDKLHPYTVHTILCRAVELDDYATIDALVNGGADVDYFFKNNPDLVHFNMGEPTPVNIAITKGDLTLLKKLLDLGGIIRRIDLMPAYWVSQEFGCLVETLMDSQ